jgi:predicted CoA-binding protein
MLSLLRVKSSISSSSRLAFFSGHAVGMADPAEVKAFFNLSQFVVVGASTDRNKFGNKILRCYLEHGKTAIPINKKEKEIEGLVCKAGIQDVAQQAAVTGVSIVTPPAVSKQVIEEGIILGFRNFFLQPGTADAQVEEVIRREQAKHGKEIRFIQDCVLVQLGCDH